MTDTHLPGLEGTNPIGFLAALGIQVAFITKPRCPRLWWSNDVIPHAVVDGNYNVSDIADQVMSVLPSWYNSPAVNPKFDDGVDIPKGDELKFTPEDIRHYLHANSQSLTGRLSSALVAEGSLDNNGVAKPSDLYFVAGNQKFMDIVRQILKNVSKEDICAGILGPWEYKSEIPSLGWDVSDDRIYALRAGNPSSETKFTNPGPETLAILGLSTHDVFAGKDRKSKNRTITCGCSGSWKNSVYSWPVWSRPASFHAVKSLLAHTYNEDKRRHNWFAGWGVTKILQSHIRRSSQGGYGTFSPAEVAWSV